MLWATAVGWPAVKGVQGTKNQDLGGNPADFILLTHENIYILTYKICVKIGYCSKRITAYRYTIIIILCAKLCPLCSCHPPLYIIIVNHLLFTNPPVYSSYNNTCVYNYYYIIPLLRTCIYAWYRYVNHNRYNRI